MAVDRSRKATAARRRKRRMARVEHDLSDLEWAALKAAWGGCAYCGATDRPLQRDCVLAISRGGRYTLDNIAPACQPCNASKSNDEVTSWLRRKKLDERRFLLRHAEVQTMLKLALTEPPAEDAADDAVDNDVDSDPTTSSAHKPYDLSVSAVVYRTWTSEDIPFLWDMLYQSLHVREGNAPFPREVLDSPDIAHYLNGFGTRSGDDARVCVDAGGERVGAAWVRRMAAADPGYGYVSDDIPELGMALVEHRRGQGIGRHLLELLLADHPRMSLSVDDTNVGAKSLYVSLGFVPVDSAGGSTTMVREADLDPAGTTGQHD